MQPNPLNLSKKQMEKIKYECSLLRIDVEALYKLSPQLFIGELPSKPSKKPEEKPVLETTTETTKPEDYPKPGQFDGEEYYSYL